MFPVFVAIFIGISVLVTIIRVTLAISRGEVSQLFDEDPFEENSALDPWALENHGLSPGDVGYHRHFD